MFGCEKLAAVRVSRRKRSRSPTCDANSAGSTLDRKSTRLNSSHTEIYTLSLHDALPILDGDDVRVREAGGGARLPQEAVAEPDLRRELRREHLERDGTVQPQVAREVHGAHPAAPELALDGVAVPEGPAEGGGGVRGRRGGRGGGHARNMAALIVGRES